MTQSLKQNHSKKVRNLANKIINKEKTTGNPTSLSIPDLLKQKLATLVNRDSNARRVQNHQFAISQKSFYIALINSNNSIEAVHNDQKLPTVESTRKFWEPNWRSAS